MVLFNHDFPHIRLMHFALQLLIVVVLLVVLVAIIAHWKHPFAGGGGGSSLAGLSAMHDFSTKEKQEAIIEIVEADEREDVDPNGEMLRDEEERVTE